MKQFKWRNYQKNGGIGGGFICVGILEFLAELVADILVAQKRGKWRIKWLITAMVGKINSFQKRSNHELCSLYKSIYR